MRASSHSLTGIKAPSQSGPHLAPATFLASRLRTHSSSHSPNTQSCPNLGAPFVLITLLYTGPTTS